MGWIACYWKANCHFCNFCDFYATAQPSVIRTTLQLPYNRNHLACIPIALQSNGGRTQKIWFKFLAKCYRTTLCASVARHWVWATSLKIFQPTVKCDNPDQFGIGRIGGLYLEIQKSSQPCPCCLLTGCQLFHYVIVFPCSRLKLETNFFIPNSEQGYITVASTPGRFVWRLKYNNWSLKFENWNIVLNSGCWVIVARDHALRNRSHSSGTL